MSRSGRKGSYTNYKSYGYSGGGYSGGGYKDADFIGIEWEPVYPGKFDNNEIFQPLDGEVINDNFAVQFQVDKDQFDVAAALSLDGEAFAEVAGGLTLAIGAEPATAAAIAATIGDYDLVAAVELEGYAKAGDHPGYARNFFVDDEVEAYIALINDGGTPTDHTDDEVALAIGVEVELTKKGARKFDALFDGGRPFDATVMSAMSGMSSSQMDRFIDEIEITIDVNTYDPLIGLIGDALEEAAIDLSGFGDALASTGIDIEVEFGSVEPSKWAANAIDDLLTTVNEIPMYS
jgi:hypothetical protein